MCGKCGKTPSSRTRCHSFSQVQRDWWISHLQGERWQPCSRSGAGGLLWFHRGNQRSFDGCRPDNLRQSHSRCRESVDQAGGAEYSNPHARPLSTATHECFQKWGLPKPTRSENQHMNTNGLRSLGSSPSVILASGSINEPFLLDSLAYKSTRRVFVCFTPS